MSSIDVSLTPEEETWLDQQIAEMEILAFDEGTPTHLINGNKTDPPPRPTQRGGYSSHVTGKDEPIQ